MLSFAYEPSVGAVLNKQIQAFGVSPRQRAAIRAWRYYDGTAYDPSFGLQFGHPFTEWDETAKGKRPAVQPISKRITEISAQFLFSDAPRFIVGDPDDQSDDSLQKLLDDIIRMNGLVEKLLPEARAASLEGGTVPKFAWTPTNKKRPVLIQFQHPYDVNFEVDALDEGDVKSARLRFKYMDASGQWWWYQEIWTPERFTIYEKLAARAGGQDNVAINQGFKNGQWPIADSGVNPFGLIPFTAIYNKVRKSDPNGYGDCWDENIYQLFDDYNLFCWLERFSNQMDANAIIAIINAAYDGPLSAGMTVQLQGEGADIKRIESNGSIREWIVQSKQDTLKMIYDGVGYDNVDPELVTNKGSLTRSVWNLMFAKSIRSTREKQSHWGENGLCRFFEDMLEGLSRLPDAVALYPALRKVNPDDPTSFDVTCEWPEMFQTTPEERGEVLADLSTSVSEGFLTRDRAVGLAAAVWGITDVEALKEELKDDHERRDMEAQAQTQMVVKQAQAVPVEKDVKGDS